MADSEKRIPHNPPWLFAPLAASPGIGYWGINGLLIPYLLRKHGVSVDRIAEIAAIANIPIFCYFLSSPIMDLGFSRRTWILLMNGTMALCLSLAVIGTPGSLVAVGALMAAGNTAGSLGVAAAGAVMTTLRPHMRGRASGWNQLGNIGLGALAGGACIWLADHVSLGAVSLAAAAFAFFPALFAFRIVESPHPPLEAGPMFHAFRHDIVSILRSWRTLVAILFFCARRRRSVREPDIQCRARPGRQLAGFGSG